MITNGILALVVGPSGSGKDTLLDAARQALAGHPLVHFATRAVTRPADAGGEQHEAITTAAFEAAERSGQFALAWRANGLAYGVRHSELAPLAAGRVVALNASRTVVRQARLIATRVTVLHVTAPVAVLAERIARRGRESAAEAAARLARQPIPAVEGVDLVTIDNGGTLVEGQAAFIAALRRLTGMAKVAPAR